MRLAEKGGIARTRRIHSNKVIRGGRHVAAGSVVARTGSGILCFRRQRAGTAMLKPRGYPPVKPAGIPQVSTIDPALLGTWRDSNNLLFVYAPDVFDPAQADATVFFGGGSTPYRLEDAGQTLVVNNNTRYARQDGTANSIVGRWRDDAGGEEWTLRADGRYIIVFDGDPMLWFGTYQATANALVTYEFRGRVATQGVEIFYTWYPGYRISGTYTLVGNTLTVTRTDGVLEVYQRV